MIHYVVTQLESSMTGYFLRFFSLLYEIFVFLEGLEYATDLKFL